jgi:hypothetical protein
MAKKPPAKPAKAGPGKGRDVTAAPVFNNTGKTPGGVTGKGFMPGCAPGPGRPPGSRNRLSEDLLSTLAADFEQHGAAVVKQTREQDPVAYLRIVAALVPREDRLEITKIDFNEMTDGELAAAIAADTEAIARLENAGAAESPADSRKLN